MNMSFGRKYSLTQIIQVILLFLMSMNFANMSYYIVLLTFLICIFANFRFFRVDITALLLVLISLCYLLFYPPMRSTYTTIIKQFSYPMCYLIGLNLVKTGRGEGKVNDAVNEQIRLSILVTAFGTFFHYFLNASINITSLLRNTADYWTGDIVSATGQALLAVMALGVFSVWLVGDYTVRRKGLSLAGLIAVFAYNFVLAGRTLIVLEIIMICVAFLFTQTHMSSKRRIKIYIFLTAVFVIIMFLFLNNVWGVREWIINSNLSNRFDSEKAISDARFEKKVIYASFMLKYPFGGGLIRETVGGYAHELYLDGYSDVGILGYSLIIAVVIMGTGNVIKHIRSKDLDIETRSLLLCVFLGINVVFMLEPILQGAPWVFDIFCFLSGVTRRGWRLLRNSHQN